MRPPRWPGRRRSGRPAGSLPILVSLLLVCLVLPLPAVEGAPPSRGDYFEYETEEFITGGGGAYSGYDEKTSSWGRYEVVGAEGANVTVHYNYRWNYNSDTEPAKSGSADNYLTFDRASRVYVQGFDLDQDRTAGATVWFWIPPSVKQGDRVRMLDEWYTVTNLDATIWSKFLPYKAVELSGSGSFDRNDDYGRFSATYTDRYYFDRESGYIVAERYEEHDEGSFEGNSASFDWKFNLDVTKSSYPRKLDWGTFTLVYIGLPALVIAILYGIWYAIRWRTRTVYLPGGDAVKLMRLRKRRRFIWGPGRTTRFFGPLLPDIVSKAQAVRDRVAVAIRDGEMAGLAIYHRDVKVGTIFAPDTHVNEALRRFVGAKDFFSETLHRDPQGGGSPGGVYNLHETHKILVNRAVAPVPFDAGAIREMTEADLPRVCAISKKVYRVRGRRWYRTLLEKGDIGLVAVSEGHVEGFAFATLAGEWARFHTLTVSPEHRGRGLGKELMRARLSLAYYLGATCAMVEIADWNLPSLRISTSLGFVPEGQMHVESARRRRKERRMVRR